MVWNTSTNQPIFKVYRTRRYHHPALFYSLDREIPSKTSYPFASQTVCLTPRPRTFSFLWSKAPRQSLPSQRNIHSYWNYCRAAVRFVKVIQLFILKEFVQQFEGLREDHRGFAHPATNFILVITRGASAPLVRYLIGGRWALVLKHFHQVWRKPPPS